jgi:gas vesicle protein
MEEDDRMITGLVGFMIGLLVGVPVGIFTAALLTAGRSEDEEDDSYDGYDV